MRARKTLPVKTLQEIVYAITRKIVKSENLSVEDIVSLTTQAIEVAKLLQNVDRAQRRRKKPEKLDIFGERGTG
jgi:hypothetical protein